jgi:hypothetical protein
MHDYIILKIEKSPTKMVKISLATAALVIASAATVSQATLFNPESLLSTASYYLGQGTDPTKMLDDAHVKYYFSCLNGLQGGFISGFYDNETETVSAECLGEQTFKTSSQLVHDISSGNIADIFKSFNLIYQTSYLVQKTCRTNEISYQVVGYCLNASTSCNPQSISENFVNNIFKITAQLNEVVAVIVKEYESAGSVDLTNLKKANSDFHELGQALGQIARVLIGFPYHSGIEKKPYVPPTPTF